MRQQIVQALWRRKGSLLDSGSKEGSVPSASPLCHSFFHSSSRPFLPCELAFSNGPSMPRLSLRSLRAVCGRADSATVGADCAAALAVFIDLCGGERVYHNVWSHHLETL